MNHRDEWRPILEAEVKRWSAKSTQQLLSDLEDEHVYQLTFDGTEYNIEVSLLENTDQYIHVLVSVDDGRLPASFRPLSDSIIRRK
jgi:hypothetical protein